MTEPTFELLELATPYALHAISDHERTALERQLTAVPISVADAFRDEVRGVREAMAVVSAATAAESPARLRAAVLTAVSDGNRPSRRRTVLLAGAAAIAGGLVAFGAGLALRRRTRRTHGLAGVPDGRHRHRGVLTGQECRCAGDEQSHPTTTGLRLPDVAAQR